LILKQFSLPPMLVNHFPLALISPNKFGNKQKNVNLFVFVLQKLFNDTFGIFKYI